LKENILNMHLKVAVHTVGCRSNQADSSVLKSYLNPEKIEIVPSFSDCDLLIVNTCCITASAEKDCKKAVRRALKNNSELKVVLTGCAVSAFSDFADNMGDNVSTFGGGATNLKDLGLYINDKGADFSDKTAASSTKSGNYKYFESSDKKELSLFANIDDRNRALLKIQNGCTHNCSYCIVPKARGPEQSMPAKEILHHINRFKEAGYKELVLTGVQLGAWGVDLPGTPSVASILETAADLFAPGRIRLGSIEPWSVNEQLLDIIANHQNVCPHLHIPLQSGDDKVLLNMKRGYTALQYLNIVEKLYKKNSSAAIGTDVLCGFPGEDDNAFKNTLSLLKKIKPAYVHGFSYSARPYTAAYKMDLPFSREMAKARVRKLLKYADKWSQNYKISQAGRKCQIFIENRGRGLTDTFLTVITSSEAEKGELVTATLNLSDDNSKYLVAN
jgi:threonylcarbamoyladenosine tRNA methylthiotransferase MtaB